MRLIVMGDIHGNIEALNSVIEDAINSYAKDINGFVFLGDYCCDFLEGKECVERIINLSQQYNVYVISGNRETDMVKKYYETRLKGEKVPWSIDTTMGAPLLSCDRMTAEQLKYLSTLPDKYILNLPGADPIYLQHKIPLSGEVKMSLKKRGIKNILSAHTHAVNEETHDGFNFFNPGSVGLTDNGKQGANYGVMTFKNGRWMMEPKLVKYNYEAMVKKVSANQLLIDKCENWGLLLIISVKYGINACSRYAYEKSRIAKLYAENKNYIVKNSTFKKKKDGNIVLTNTYFPKKIVIEKEYKYLKYKWFESSSKKEKYPVEDWMKNLALENILNNLARF